MLDLLSIVPGTGKNEGNYVFDNLGEPFLYALIGFVIVFLGIVIIIGVIWLVGLIMRKTNNLEFLTKKKEKKSKAIEEKQPATVAAVDSDEVPEEVAAAIVAAVMAYYQQEEGKCEFTVKRIKRI